MIWVLAVTLRRYLHLKESTGESGVALVALDDPFRGGYITKKHSLKGNMPGIQVEFKNLLYLTGVASTVIPRRETKWLMLMIKNCFADGREELFYK